MFIYVYIHIPPYRLEPEICYWTAIFIFFSLRPPAPSLRLSLLHSLLLPTNIFGNDHQISLWSDLIYHYIPNICRQIQDKWKMLGGGRPGWPGSARRLGPKVFVCKTPPDPLPESLKRYAQTSERFCPKLSELCPNLSEVCCFSFWRICATTLNLSELCPNLSEVCPNLSEVVSKALRAFRPFFQRFWLTSQSFPKLCNRISCANFHPTLPSQQDERRLAPTRSKSNLQFSDGAFAWRDEGKAQSACSVCLPLFEYMYTCIYMYVYMFTYGCLY